MKLLCDSANCVAEHCFGKRLEPGATMSDHSSSAQKQLSGTWPNAPHGQCWPHIIRKFHEGQLPGSVKGQKLSKKHPHFEEVEIHLRAFHMCQSEGMQAVLCAVIAKVHLYCTYTDNVLLLYCMLYHAYIIQVWDSWGRKYNLEVLWNEYLCEPWDNWSIGLFDCPLTTPSQQSQERWHRSILESIIPGMFKGSTEHVMQVCTCRIFTLYVYYIRTILREEYE